MRAAGGSAEKCRKAKYAHIENCDPYLLGFFLVAATMSDLLILVFQPDNPCNTIIIDEETGKVMYQVATEHGKSTVTRVKNAVGESIASWEWRDVRSDIITLGNGTPTSVSSWLKKSLVPFKE